MGGSPSYVVAGRGDRYSTKYVASRGAGTCAWNWWYASRGGRVVVVIIMSRQQDISRQVSKVLWGSKFERDRLCS